MPTKHANGNVSSTIGKSYIIYLPTTPRRVIEVISRVISRYYFRPWRSIAGDAGWGCFCSAGAAKAAAHEYAPPGRASLSADDGRGFMSSGISMPSTCSADGRAPRDDISAGATGFGRISLMIFGALISRQIRVSKNARAHRRTREAGYRAR